MNDKFRIVLEDKLLPVQAFFNAIPDRSFIETLKGFKNGVGAGFNETYCGFPGEEEFDEEPLIGIEFAVMDEEVILNYGEFYDILIQVCDSYLKNLPDEKEEVTSLCDGIKEKLYSL